MRCIRIINLNIHHGAGMKKLSLIIAVYNRIDFLELVLQSIENQIFKDFEIIIAEDNNSMEMKRFILESKIKYSFDIRHVCQNDKGFRKNRILNRAVRIADSNYLVFIDGDCILHPGFLSEYAVRAQPDLCLFGRRVRLDKKTTEQIIKTGDFKLLSLFRLLFTKTTRIEDGFYFPFYTPRKKKNILGCNFCVSKSNMITINGFDEDFECPLYGEDTDVRRRLEMIGVKLESTKFKAIQYHLFHPVGDRAKCWDISGRMYEKKLSMGRFYCLNGLVKIQK